MRTQAAVPLERAWAMEEGRLATLVRAIESALSADREILGEIRQTLSITRREARAAGAGAGEGGYTLTDGIAVVSLDGVLTKNQTCFGAFFGGDAVTSEFVDAMSAAAADPNAREIVVRVDSPGGSVDGTAEAADAVWAARQVKPVTAYVDGLAASGAYWIASQASRVVINNSTARVGSIGVFCVIPDTSRAFENRGVRVHVVKAGEAKGGGTAGVPVTSEVLSEIQREVSALYEEFVSAVSRGRGISPEQARALADGRVHVGRAAIELGLVDGIASLEEAMSGMSPAVAMEPVIETAPMAGLNDTRAEEVAPLTAAQEEDEMSDTPPNLESRLEALEKARADADEKAAKEIASLKAENEALRAKVDETASTVATVTSDRDADRLVAELRGELGGPVRLAAKDEDGEKVVRDRVAAKGIDESRDYFTRTLAVLGKGEGSVATASGVAVSKTTTRHRFDVFGPERWAGSSDPQLQAYGRKIEWIDATEKAGRKFKNAAEAFAAYDAAHKAA